MNISAPFIRRPVMTLLITMSTLFFWNLRVFVASSQQFTGGGLSGDLGHGFLSWSQSDDDGG